MKKTLIILFLALAVVALFLTGCGPSHTHEFGGKYLYDANGHWQLCQLEDCDEPSSASPHVWNAGEETIAPTYTQQGKKVFTCTTCGATKEESIPALDVVPSTVVFSSELSLDKVYDSSPVTLTSSHYSTTGNGEVTVEWYQGENKLDDAPALPGDYSVKISISASEGYSSASATQNFTISKKALSGTIEATADFGVTELEVLMDGILTGGMGNDTLGMVEISNNGEFLTVNTDGHTSGLTLTFSQFVLDRYDVSGVDYKIVINKSLISADKLLIDNADTLPASFCVDKGIVADYTYTGVYAKYLGTPTVEYADASVGVTMTWSSIAPKKVGHYAVRISFAESDNTLASRTTPVEFKIEAHDTGFDGYCIVDGIKCDVAPVDLTVDDEINTTIGSNETLVYRMELQAGTYYIFPLASQQAANYTVYDIHGEVQMEKRSNVYENIRFVAKDPVYYVHVTQQGSITNILVSVTEYTYDFMKDGVVVTEVTPGKTATAVVQNGQFWVKVDNKDNAYANYRFLTSAPTQGGTSLFHDGIYLTGLNTNTSLTGKISSLYFRAEGVCFFKFNVLEVLDGTTVTIDLVEPVSTNVSGSPVNMEGCKPTENGYVVISLPATKGYYYGISGDYGTVDSVSFATYASSIYNKVFYQSNTSDRIYVIVKVKDASENIWILDHIDHTVTEGRCPVCGLTVESTL